MEDCKHKWIVNVDEDNIPEDVMCSECNEIFIMVVRDCTDEPDTECKRCNGKGCIACDARHTKDSN